MPQQTIAITGATGFIGGHIMAALLARGDHVQALTRRARPDQAGIRWISGDMADDDALARLVRGADAVIHCAGLVKARSKTAFFDANADAVARLLSHVRAETPTARVIHLSSLAAREPGLSDYAASKAAGETILHETSDLLWCGLRPPAVYGPGDMEILKIFKSLKFGVGFLPGGRAARLSLIHVQDLMAAVLALLDAPQASVRGQIFELDDGRPNGYGLAEVYEIAAAILGRRVHLLPVPARLLGLIGALNQILSRLTGQAPMLTPGKARELTHPDWVAQSPLLNRSGLWDPRIGLQDGLAETLAWYRHNFLF
ncbi:NAD-dependent epimerase/dehydratase family protein [Govanella unica]|uniref:SDR family NAD(P)-dependent oxidoreductase n=1 Tax=Govanella unica TaxID=2975056 RepID=A0A9X3Z704_9PROT|nr:SDR family NAD(P)-dependent oxidoreductase [Govania unica]MDA5193652.1 SDR family NAD(P)-dependent oxidoreductase [Govania unica]